MGEDIERLGTGRVRVISELKTGFICLVNKVVWSG